MEYDIRELQKIQLEIAIEVKRICEKYDIKYFLIGGTLLGAVRHKGFIPWDDDFDIGMPREDYDAFISLCGSELNESFYLQSYETDPVFWRNFAKVRKNATFFNEFEIRNKDTHKGIFIDIFPYDNADKIYGCQMYIQSFIVRFLSAIIVRKLNVDTGPVTSLKNRFLKISSKVISVERAIRWQMKAMKLNCKRKVDYFVSFGSQYNHRKETMPISKYLPIKEMEFEGIMFKVPNNSDYVLHRIFGDYMTLPPEEKRGGQHAIEVRFDL